MAEVDLSNPVSAAGGETASDAGEDFVPAIDYGPDGKPGAGDEAAGEEREEPAQEPEKPAAEPNEPTEELTPEQELTALQTRFDDGEPLTSEEKSRLRSLQQSRDDRERARTQARTQLAANQERIKQLGETFPQKVLGHVDAELRLAVEEGRGVSATLLKTAVQQSVEELAKDAEPLFLLRWDAGVRERVLEVGGDAAGKALEDLEPGDFGGLLGLAFKSYYEAGQGASPDAKKVAKLEKQVAELKAAAEKTKTSSGTKSTAGRETRGTNLGAQTYSERLRNGETVNSDEVDDWVRREFAEALA